jgi:hypothetical protein
MRTLLLGAAATLSLLGASVSAAQAAPAGPLVSGVYLSGDAATLQPVQFFFGGENYCWYVSGWRGPGYYYCGYAWRRGLGWGGGAGWNGWRGSGGGRSGVALGVGVRAGGGRGAAAFTGGGHSGGGRAAAQSVAGGHSGGGHSGAATHSGGTGHSGGASHAGGGQNRH